ncbi:MAG: hypothetical protein EPN30_09195 [Actinomycetota bacterium]|nr:MAG: hypothetical protein EPN30_09195 [Actinomycetota bacterium]
MNFGDGPGDAGEAAAQSAIRDDYQVCDALQLLTERFESEDNDGPHAYGAFLAGEGDSEEAARLRQEAVAVVRDFLAAMG